MASAKPPKVEPQLNIGDVVRRPGRANSPLQLSVRTMTTTKSGADDRAGDQWRAAPRDLGQRPGQPVVAGHGEEPARRRDRDADEHGQHVEHDDQLDAAAAMATEPNPPRRPARPARTAARRRSCRSRRGRSGSRRPGRRCRSGRSRRSAMTEIRTARGMSRLGWAVSSPRLAAVSKPVNSSTPYSTPNSTPPRPLRRRAGLERLGDVVAAADLGDDVDREDQHDGDRDQRQHQLGAGRQRDAEVHDRGDDHQQHDVPAQLGSGRLLELGGQGVVDGAADHHAAGRRRGPGCLRSRGSRPRRRSVRRARRTRSRRASRRPGCAWRTRTTIQPRPSTPTAAMQDRQRRRRSRRPCPRRSARPAAGPGRRSRRPGP